MCNTGDGLLKSTLLSSVGRRVSFSLPTSEQSTHRHPEPEGNKVTKRTGQELDKRLTGA